MKVIETRLKGCFIIEPTIFKDSRGYFFESFNQKTFEEALGRPLNFVQDNQSFSTEGTIRALHYQKGQHAQAKLVRVLQGTVLDVAVDLRKDSPTFGRYEAVELSAENKRQLYIPKGFAHGFITLSETSEFFYKCDNYYNKEAEGGIIYNDPQINIDWGFSGKEVQLSERDAQLPQLKDAKL